MQSLIDQNFEKLSAEETSAINKNYITQNIVY